MRMEGVFSVMRDRPDPRKCGRESAPVETIVFVEKVDGQIRYRE